MDGDTITLGGCELPAGYIRYTYVHENPAFPGEEGNIEYYIGSDGKYYVKENGEYVEIPEGSWVIPAVTVTKVEAKEPTATESGNIEYYIGSDGNYYTYDPETGHYFWIDESDWYLPATGGGDTPGGEIPIGEVNWDSRDVRAIEIGYGEGSFSSKGITVNPAGDSNWSGEDIDFGPNEEGFIFSAAGGTFTKIVINCDEASGPDETLGSGWRVSDHSTLTWTGSSDAVSLSWLAGSVYGISSITFTIGPGGSGSEGFSVMPLSADVIANINSVDDMPGNFVQVELEEAQSWTGADADGWAHLIYGIDGDRFKEAEFTDGRYSSDRITDVEMLKRYVEWGENVYYVTGSGSGSSGGFSVAPLSAESVDNMFSVDDIPGNFVQVELAEARSWTGADASGDVHLIYGIDDDLFKVAEFVDGSYDDDMYVDIDMLKRYAEWGEKIYYVTGSGGHQGEIDEPVTYTITWLNDDGSVIDFTEVEEGAVPTHANPTKAADAHYTYTFSGWEPEITAAYDDAEYTATYTAAKKPLTISKGQYIRMGTYNGVPVDWYCQRINGTGTFMLCKYALKADKFGSDATYKTSNIHAWLDLNSGGTFATDLGLTKAELALVRTLNLSGSGGDGTDSFIIPAYANDELNKGVTVQAPYNINNPSSLINTYWLRTARDTSNARIINHSKDGSPVATVAARYSGVGNSQWIRPMFYLDTNAIKNMEFTGSGTQADPYVFESRYAVNANITPNGGGTVTAKASRDGQVIFNGKIPAQIVADAAVELTVTPAAGYEFKGITVTDDNNNTITLTDNKFVMPSNGVHVTAEFEKQKFTVIWKDEDGTVLKTDENVEYGTTPSYSGETPVKASDAQYTYTFTGWTPEVKAVTGDVTYTAVYSASARNYTVTWKNGDEVIKTDTVAYGTVPAYDGADPVKADDDKYTYTFSGWTPEITAVTGNAEYTATFDAASKAKNGPQADGYFYLNDVRQNAYQLIKFEDNYYFINDAHKYAKSMRLYMSERFVKDFGLDVGYYDFDADGKMIVVEKVVKNGPQDDGYFYIDDVRQNAYQLISFNGSYYFINDAHKYAKSVRLYMSERFVKDFGLDVGYYDFDADGKMIIVEKVVKNGPQDDGYFYLNDVRQNAYQLIKYEDNYYFINDAHKYAKSMRLYMSERFVKDYGLAVGYYDFDADGKMIIVEEPVKNGPQADGYFYIDNVRQNEYQLVEYEGDYYFINDGHKIAKNVNLYLRDSFVAGTDLAPGYYAFDADGKLIFKNGPADDGYFYLNGVRQNAYQLIKYEDNYFFINDAHKYAKSMRLYLSERFVKDHGLAVGYYDFDADGKMVVNE